MGKIHRKIVAAGVCCLMTGMLTGCGSDTTKITEGMQLVETLDYQGALNAFDEAEAQKEDSRLIARGRGIASMGLTEYDQAVEYFTQALELSDGWVQNVDYDMNYYLAAAYTKNGQPAEAKKVYDAILGLKPEEKDAYFLRGSAELELGDYESAKADFDQAISMDPKNYDRLIEIYEALAAHGYREVGQEYLQNVLDTAKQLDAYDSGRIYYYLGEYQKAYLALDEARDKGGADSYLYLGRAYAATGDYNYASSVYNNYLSKQGPNAEIYNELGLCEMAKKEYQNALAAFQAGKQIEGNSLMQTLCFNEIVAYEYLEDYQQAEVLMNAYLQNYPDDQTAIRISTSGSNSSCPPDKKTIEFMDQSLAESSREEDSAFSLNCSRSTKSSREAMFFGLKCCITSTTSDTVVPGTHSCLRTSGL